MCLCVLSKRIPALNPAAQTTGFHAPVRLSKMTDETCQLIGAVISVMAELPDLCSNAGQYYGAVDEREVGVYVDI